MEAGRFRLGRGWKVARVRERENRSGVVTEVGGERAKCRTDLEESDEEARS